MRKIAFQLSTLIVSCVSGLVLTVSAHASTMIVGKAFFAGDPVTTFDGLATGTEVNGLTVNGITYRYLIGGTPTNGQVIIDGGPGTTNNIAPQNVVSTGNNSGTLVLTLPTLATSVGYGFADLSQVTLADATTIMLFNGLTNVGSQNFSGAPDPVFTGGFAGISSTLAFNTVAITFDSVDASAFALDNVTYGAATSITPEPGTLLLVASGVGSVLAGRRRRR